MAPETVALAPPRPYLWTSEEFDHLVELGVFDGKHVELIEGALIQMAPAGSVHEAVVTVIYRRLERIFAPDILVRGQMSLNFGEASQLEPDVAVVAGDDWTYLKRKPTTALLVVEVSDSSLTYDRATKARLYARAGIPDYWVINLPDRQVEVYRQPTASGYAEQQVLRAGDTVTPLAAPGATLAVGDLLPPE